MNSRKGEVEADCSRGQWNTEQLTRQDVEPEGSIDEQIVECSQPTDDQGIEDGKEEQQPRKRVE